MVLYLTLGENYHENSRWQRYFKDLNGREDSWNQIQQIQRAANTGRASSAKITVAVGSSQADLGVQWHKMSRLLYRLLPKPYCQPHWKIANLIYWAGRSDRKKKWFQMHFTTRFLGFLFDPKKFKLSSRRIFPVGRKTSVRKMKRRIKRWGLPFSWAISCRQK